MATDLRDDLTEIHGVGDATADEILAVLDEHGQGGVPDTVRDHIQEAHDHHQAGEHEYAAKFVRRAVDALEADKFVREAIEPLER